LHLLHGEMFMELRRTYDVLRDSAGDTHYGYFEALVDLDEQTIRKLMEEC